MMRMAMAALGAACLAITPAQANEVRVALDQAAALPLSAPASGIVIGNPSIAGVSIQSERLLFVTGRSYGSTNLVVVGKDGARVGEFRLTVVPDESGAVMLTRGSQMVRLDCAPTCRRRPDISDDPGAFQSTVQQITTRAGQASSNAPQ